MFLFQIGYLVLFAFISITAFQEDGFTESVVAVEVELPEGLGGDSDFLYAATNPKGQPNKNGGSATTLKPVTNSTTKGLLLNQNQSIQPIDCRNISSELLSADQDYCCFGPTVFSQETLFRCQIANRNHVDWFYDDPPENECVVQCMFEAQNLLNNDTIDKQRLINETLWNRSFDRPVWEPIVTKSIDECLKPERIQFNSTGPISCSPRPYIVLQCLYVELMKNCPAEKLNSDAKCTDLKQFVQACNDIPKHKKYVFN